MKKIIIGLLLSLIMGLVFVTACDSVSSDTLAHEGIVSAAESEEETIDIDELLEETKTQSPNPTEKPTETKKQSKQSSQQSSKKKSESKTQSSKKKAESKSQSNKVEYAVPIQNNDNQNNASYVLNTNTHKFHYPSCSSVYRMKDKNKEYYSGSRESLIAQGYSPCGKCHP